MKKLSFTLFTFVFGLSLHSLAVDLEQIGKDLQGPGVTGWIHGALAERGIYVFTYRNPADFFDYVEMSLVTDDAALTGALASFGRNDKVLVKGSFMNNPSPQKHIALTSIELVTKYNSGYPVTPYAHNAKIPADLLNINHANFLVHAVAGDGHILVVEFEDAIVPVFVKDNALTKGLYRNDVIDMYFKIQSYPGNPTHLNLDDTATQPLKVVDSILSVHGKTAFVEGELIMFPKSPEIVLNVFAVQQKLPNGLSRQFTLANLEDPTVFHDITKKLQAAWDKYPGQYVNGRNKLVSKHIRVLVYGSFNEVDPSQANAQVLLKSAKAIQIIDRP